VSAAVANSAETIITAIPLPMLDITVLLFCAGELLSQAAVTCSQRRRVGQAHEIRQSWGLRHGRRAEGI
jgi:hypothetical protein